MRPSVDGRKMRPLSTARPRAMPARIIYDRSRRTRDRSRRLIARIEARLKAAQSDEERKICRPILKELANMVRDGSPTMIVTTKRSPKRRGS
jgi:hypothetical protein